MAELIVVRHLFRPVGKNPPKEVRETLPLKVGESIEHNLRALFPHGLQAPWRLYRGEADPEFYLPYMSHLHPVEDDTYVLVILPAGPPAAIFAFAFETAMSLALSSLATALATRHRRESAPPEREQPSPNNVLSGQTNVLRPSARVPDILGKVRAYPDLLSAEIATWDGRTQQLEQWFVLGIGDYLVELPRLGETAVSSIANAHVKQYAPGDEVPQIRAVKTAPEVNAMSLMTEEGASVGVTGVSFSAAGTMSMPVAIPSAAVGNLLAIHNTISNDGFFKITSLPSSGPPYVYGLDGAHVNEPSVDLVYDHFANMYTLSRKTTFFDDTVRASDQFEPPPSGGLGATNGYAVELVVPAPHAATYRGIIRNLSTFNLGPPTIMDFSLENIGGAFFEWPSSYTVPNTIYHLWMPAGASPSGGALLMTPAPTAWYRVPLDELDAVLVDIGFPDGLVLYESGARHSLSVDVKVEFCRPGVGAAQATFTETFSGDTTGPLRFTKQYLVSALALPTGTGIEVRLTRLTTIPMDTATQQYISTTRWESLRAVKLVTQNNSPATILQLTMTNTRSAVSLGQTSFNCLATRKLPTWTGTAWSAAAPTERWADALVARMKASDGGRKLDAQIDIAGIYAIQSTLDAMEGGSGDQGRISLTLDKLQDVDSELQQIANVARALVYRIGTKLFVSRDEGGKTPVALFSGRSKHPDGETLEFSLRSETDPDAVIVQWFDRAHAWKLREYQYPPSTTPLNPLRITPPFATWAQAWRRAHFEWDRLTLRRDTLSMQATEEALLIHPGDVVQVVDDVGNLAQSAGEVLAVNGLTLTLDLPVTLAGALSIMLRDQHGRSTALIGCTPGATAHEVTLASAPPFEVKGRDDALGSIYSLYAAGAANVQPWLVQALEPDALYVRLTCANWREDVYASDTATLPDVPPLVGSSAARLEADAVGALP